MAAISPQMRVADLVEGRPWLARILIAQDVFPSDTNWTLERACRDLDFLLDLLEPVADGPAGLQFLSQKELVRHIVECHHRYIRRVLPGLLDLGESLTRRYRQLKPLLVELQLFSRTIQPHLFREEQVVFPAIRDLEHDASMAPHLGRWISSLLAEHAGARHHFAGLRQLTANFRMDPAADPDYRSWVAGLAELDQDMAWHIFAETDLLFPRAQRSCPAA